MAAITTRQTGTTGIDGVTRKNLPLTNTEIDNNFISLNNNKAELSLNLSDIPNKTTARANLGLTLGSDVQAYDTDLAAIANLNTNGIIVRTSAGNMVTRVIGGSGENILVTNGDGVSGNVAIAVGSNIPKLDATSNIFSGDITAANINSTSDATLKHDIQKIELALETVRQLDGVGFTWNNTGKRTFGVVAQEIEKVIPELVETENGVKSVNYLGIIAFLINSVKELDKELQELKARNT